MGDHYGRCKKEEPDKPLLDAITDICAVCVGTYAPVNPGDDQGVHAQHESENFGQHRGVSYDWHRAIEEDRKAREPPAVLPGGPKIGWTQQRVPGGHEEKE